jgi:ABC-type transporter Mla MlaB component
MSFGRSAGLFRMAAPAGTTRVFTIRGPLVRSDLPGLCARLQATWSECDTPVVLCDVDGCVQTDLAAIDALARLQLSARRSGRSIRLQEASSQLHDLLAFAGLDEVVPRRELGVEPSRQPEDGEEPFRVEEEREFGDPAT